MIEVEVKFLIDTVPDSLKKLAPSRAKRQLDVYYDTLEYTLLRSGNFMRIRNKKRLEFKLNSGDASHLYCEELDFELQKLHEHLEAIIQILRSIGLQSPEKVQSVEDILCSNDMIVLATIDKERVEYDFSDNITVCVDHVNNLGNFIEIDLMVKNDNSLLATSKEAEVSLMKVLSDNDIISDETSRVRLGYVELFLQKYNPDAYGMGLYK